MAISFRLVPIIDLRQPRAAEPYQNPHLVEIRRVESDYEWLVLVGSDARGCPPHPRILDARSSKRPTIGCCRDQGSCETGSLPIRATQARSPRYCPFSARPGKG